MLMWLCNAGDATCQDLRDGYCARDGRHDEVCQTTGRVFPCLTCRDEIKFHACTTKMLNLSTKPGEAVHPTMNLCWLVCDYATSRKRCEEVGITNLEPRIEDGQALSSFDDGSVDVVTCTWGLESMPEHEKAIEVSPGYD